MDPQNLRALFASMDEHDLRRAATFATEDSAPAGATPMRLIRITNWDVKRLPQETRKRLAEPVASHGPAASADAG